MLLIVLTLIGSAAAGVTVEEPVARVIKLLEELQTSVEADAKTEGESYDKFACWCEDTLVEKAEAISKTKGTIDELQTQIIKLMGEVATHTVEVKQAKKDIAANIKAQEEAEAMREKENGEYVDEKVESEQCIGALSAAITALSGAGSGKGKFLIQQSQLVDAAVGLRHVLGRASELSDANRQLISRFADHPSAFFHGASSELSAAQVGNNPFGDYAPQSTQITGVLKSLYDSFAHGLEKSNAEEAEHQKSFEELIATKKEELAALKKSLQTQTKDEADKTKTRADSRREIADGKAQVEADEKFFAETKATCSEKANQWAQRTRVRTMELNGIAKALEILNDPEAREAFNKADSSKSPSLVQIARHSGGTTAASEQAYAKLRGVAARYGSRPIAELAVAARMAERGHFDKVIGTIDQMIVKLREEEQEDIKHRDRCEGDTRQNSYEIEDVKSAITKLEAEISRGEDEQTELNTKITTLGEQMEATKKEKTELKEMRTKEHDEYAKAVKDDEKAIELLDQASQVLAQMYKQKRGSAMLEKDAAKVEPRPETTFHDGDYAGEKQAGTGILAIIDMIKVDLQKEMQTDAATDAKAQKSYEKAINALDDALEATAASKVAAEGDLSRLREKLADLREEKQQKGEDLSAKEEQKAGLETDCAWVKTHFESRRTKRKAELEGLEDAKNLLAGMAVEE